MPLDLGVRLAFKKNKVIETKKKGGKIHKISDKKLKRTVLGARAS